MVASAAPAAGAGTGPSQQAQTCSSFCYKTFLLPVQPQSENSFRYTRTSMSLFKVGQEQMHKTLNLTLTSKQNQNILLTHTNTYKESPRGAASGMSSRVLLSTLDHHTLLTISFVHNRDIAPSTALRNHNLLLSDVCQVTHAIIICPGTGCYLVREHSTEEPSP